RSAHTAIDLQSTLESALAEARAAAEAGRVATYIPELAHADPRGLGAALAFPSGRLIEAGEAEAPFTLQSIGKIPLLALALVESGFDEVFSRVGMEDTGDPFHSIARLELQEPDKPQNPMINAGAIAVCGLLES